MEKMKIIFKFELNNGLFLQILKQIRKEVFFINKKIQNIKKEMVNCC